MHTTAITQFEKSPPKVLLNFSSEVIPAYAQLRVSSLRHLKKENHERKNTIKIHSRPVH